MQKPWHQITDKITFQCSSYQLWTGFCNCPFLTELNYKQIWHSLKGHCVTTCCMLHVLITYLLAICEHIVRLCEQLDLPHLSWWLIRGLWTMCLNCLMPLDCGFLREKFGMLFPQQDSTSRIFPSALPQLGSQKQRLVSSTTQKFHRVSINWKKKDFYWQMFFQQFIIVWISVLQVSWSQ